MFGWLDELLNLRMKQREYNLRLKIESEQCKSCEILQIALEHANHEKEQLLRKVLNDKPETVIPESEPQPIRRHIPWKIRQQMLEAEDRQKASILRGFKDVNETENKDLTTELNTTELENQLGIK